MLPRILEPEVMDSEEDAREYDSMDHAAVNDVFVTDLLDALTDWSLQRPVSSGASTTFHILDLGAGTAQIPIELARRAPHVHITAIDAAASMLALARESITVRGLAPLIELVHADAKSLPFDDALFHAVTSNSIIHHIPEPRDVVAEAVRVTAPGGLLFHRDLCRPGEQRELDHIVATYAAGATDYQRRLFTESLHAALTLEEMQRLVADFGFAPDSVVKTSDRHWTWIAVKL
jgi:ubiquinone/menaquinone biosynthesis C-methylase UbiE